MAATVGLGPTCVGRSVRLSWFARRRRDSAAWAPRRSGCRRDLVRGV